MKKVPAILLIYSYAFKHTINLNIARREGGIFRLDIQTYSLPQHPIYFSSTAFYIYNTFPYFPFPLSPPISAISNYPTPSFLSLLKLLNFNFNFDLTPFTHSDPSHTSLFLLAELKLSKTTPLRPWLRLSRASPTSPRTSQTTPGNNSFSALVKLLSIHFWSQLDSSISPIMKGWLKQSDRIKLYTR